MENKHTKGKWTVHYPTKTDSRLMVLHPDGSRVIVNLHEGYNHPTRGPIPEEERLANAQLIAAAPELLEACKRALAYCWKSTNDNPERKLEHAIAKAMGKE